MSNSPGSISYRSCSSCVNRQNPFEVRSAIKTPEGFALTYISPYSFKIVALLLSAPLLTLSELLRLTLRWLTRATPSSATCVYFRHPPTSYLSTFPLSAHDLSHTRFRARSTLKLHLGEFYFYSLIAAEY